MLVSFPKVHEHDTHDLLRTSSRGCHEDATRKTANVEFKLYSVCFTLLHFTLLTSWVFYFHPLFLSVRRYVLAWVFEVVVCPSVCLSRRYCIETTRIELYFKEIRVSPKIRVPPWNFVPNYRRIKFDHGTPTVGKCDVNSDSGRSVVYS